jgi:maleate cis-trans isomerase
VRHRSRSAHRNAQHLGATRIALATRWQEPTNTALTRYLAEAGIEVIACRSRWMSFGENKGSSAADDHQLALELGRQVLRETPDAQALLMPGGLWYAIHAVPLLEAEYGRPVLLNILSTTRAALHAAGKRMHARPTRAGARSSPASERARLAGNSQRWVLKGNVYNDPFKYCEPQTIRDTPCPPSNKN